jgi:hypothetical protein
MNKVSQARAQDGKYTFDGNLERLCVCGHELGNHSGEAPHDCLCPTFSIRDPRRAACNCEKFRPARYQIGSRRGANC